MVYFEFLGSSANRTIFFSIVCFNIFKGNDMRCGQQLVGLAKGDNTAPTLAFLKLYKALSLNLRDLNINNVYSECLICKLDPAVVNMLYSGLN